MRCRSFMRCLHSASIAISMLSLGGCVGFSPDGGLAPAADVAAERLGKTIVKIGSDEDEANAQARVAKLLGRPLTVDAAVEVALLRNKDLQAAFNDLGVSEARFVAASLPPEPQVSIERLAGEGDVEVVRQIMISLYALATLPERQEIATERFRSAQWRAAGQVMTLARQVNRQYFMTVAARNEAALLEKSVAAAQASAELGKQLGEAGNLNKLEQAREDAFYTELGAKLADARLTAQAEREKLTRLMGLWGQDISFRLAKDLPPLPKRIVTEHDVEATALAERVDLKAARHDLDALAGRLGLTRATRYVSDVSLAAGDDVEWAGPNGGSKLGTPPNSKLDRGSFTVNFTIPIYDFGESKVRDARATYLAAANRLAQRAIDVRSQAREAYMRARGKYDLARYYAERVLPLRQTILDQSSLQYNGMLVDIPQLIIDARDRIASSINALNARRDFFIAEAELKAALVGNGPDAAPQSEGAPVPAVADAAN
ncbi:TolC family protein [Methyloferula stellata]|uniref:TolC family protein n=1 Tax=Methyloferula stellata TaxID=876270 RepID=UPI0012689C4D|nr:TolC family protein [Methyloferula stellata]